MFSVSNPSGHLLFGRNLSVLVFDSAKTRDNSCFDQVFPIVYTFSINHEAIEWKVTGNINNKSHTIDCALTLKYLPSGGSCSQDLNQILFIYFEAILYSNNTMNIVSDPKCQHTTRFFIRFNLNICFIMIFCK